MPVFLIRLEQGEHHRTHEVVADSEAQAVAFVEANERDVVAFRLNHDRLANAEAEEQRRGHPRFELVAHRQSEPYQVVSVQQIGGE